MAQYKKDTSSNKQVKRLNTKKVNIVKSNYKSIDFTDKDQIIVSPKIRRYQSFTLNLESEPRKKQAFASNSPRMLAIVKNKLQLRKCKRIYNNTNQILYIGGDDTRDIDIRFTHPIGGNCLSRRYCGDVADVENYEEWIKSYPDYKNYLQKAQRRATDEVKSYFPEASTKKALMPNESAWVCAPFVKDTSECCAGRFSKNSKTHKNRVLIWQIVTERELARGGVLIVPANNVLTDNFNHHDVYSKMYKMTGEEAALMFSEFDDRKLSRRMYRSGASEISTFDGDGGHYEGCDYDDFFMGPLPIGGTSSIKAMLDDLGGDMRIIPDLPSQFGQYYPDFLENQPAHIVREWTGAIKCVIDARKAPSTFYESNENEEKLFEYVRPVDYSHAWRSGHPDFINGEFVDVPNNVLATKPDLIYEYRLNNNIGEICNNAFRVYFLFPNEDDRVMRGGGVIEIRIRHKSIRGWKTDKLKLVKKGWMLVDPGHLGDPNGIGYYMNHDTNWIDHTDFKFGPMVVDINNSTGPWKFFGKTDSNTNDLPSDGDLGLLPKLHDPEYFIQDIGDQYSFGAGNRFSGGQPAVASIAYSFCSHTNSWHYST